MSKEALQKRINERDVFLTDLPYLYEEIKHRYDFDEAMKYKGFWAKKVESDFSKEHNLFNTSKIISLKSSKELMNNSDELYNQEEETKTFLSEVLDVVKKSEQIVIITKPSPLNFLLLEEFLNMLKINRDTRTIYYIPVYTLRSSLINDKCFFLSHCNKDDIIIEDKIYDNMENIEKYINKGHSIIEKLYGEKYLSKIINAAYLYAVNLEKEETNSNVIFENDKLYDLESLQRELFLRYGMTYDKSYMALEYLYEKGLITYYESNVRTLPEDKNKEIVEIVNNNDIIQIKKQKLRDVNNEYFEDLGDDEAHAIIPTNEFNKGYIKEVIGDDSVLKSTYLLICNSLKCIFNLHEKDELYINMTSTPTILDLVDYLLVCGFRGTEIAYMLKDNVYTNEFGYIKKNEEKINVINDAKMVMNISEIYDFVGEMRIDN